MELNIVMMLVQFVALALPAVGIYMEIVYNIRQRWREKMERAAWNDPRRQALEININPESQKLAFDSELGHSYHLARVTVLGLGMAGILLLISLLIELPPSFSQELISSTATTLSTLFVYVSVVLLLISLIFFVGSIAIHQRALQDSLGIRRSVGIFKDHIISNMYILKSNTKEDSVEDNE
ncbi:hypothetical protein [Haloarcula salinisoli]|uniref:Uncharacterized protein n=1 Tax=Haloarcula salinisoli TaxID=2487746 RepID=A0A8J8CDK8_9EURY|nr:hypothetical protein [Halomicroarcula salinisoli]MBX0304735.1 hypothetical protein [Halomicroarcula salinisoli]